MAKKFFQDIIPPEKRSIRNISLPKRPKRPDSAVPSFKDESLNGEDMPVVYPYEEKKRSSFFEFTKIKHKGIWVASGVALLIVIFAIVTNSAGATVYITPLQKKIDSDGDKIFSAKLNPDESSVGYQVITNTKEAGKLVNATGEEYVEKKASGKIVIYNTYDSSPLRLVKNTRFETPEGLIYKISDSVLIPGREGSGAQMTPGSVEVTVYADSAGDKYNIDLKDFTIPGFKNDPRFKAIYARSKTEMSGGFVGTIKKISEDDLQNARKDLQSKLTASLANEASSQLPSDYSIFPESMIYNFESLPQSDQGDNKVMINEKGTLLSVIFKKSDLARYLMDNLENGTTSPVRFDISNIDEINFSFLDKSAFNPASNDKFNFKIAGEINFVSQIDEDKLRSELAGMTKLQSGEIFKSFPEIKEGRVVIRPFWRKTVPLNSDKVKIIINSSD
ncbi:MAG TPA: hypothetical protein VJC12_00055 [Candidatus Paceibacterota bacterium]